MNYTEEKLYEFMDSQMPVRVVAMDGQEFEGRCWAYSAEICKEEYGIEEACIDIGGVMLLQSEIVEIQYVE